MRYQTDFIDLHDQLWGDLLYIEGEMSYISIVVPDEMFDRWINKTRLCPNEPFDEVSKSAGSEHSHMDICRDFEMKEDVSMLGLYCGPRNSMLIMEFEVHTVRFRSGIVLKTDDDISMYCYENYKTTDKDEWAKAKRFWSRYPSPSMRRHFRDRVLPPRSV